MTLLPAASPDDEHHYRWLVPVWTVVVGFVVLTLLRSRAVGIPMRDPRGEVFATRVALSLGVFLVLVLLDARHRAAAGGSRSPRSVYEAARRRWTPRRVALALSGLGAYHVVYLCYHNLKSWDVLNEPRDAMLLHWDRVLFLGHSPAVLLHALLGEHVAAYILMAFYESFSTLITVAVVAAVVFPNRVRDGYVFIASGLWVWILGVGSYYLIPSLGPFQSAPQQFAGLPHTMIQDTQARYLAQRAYLLAHPQAPDAFAQVSAFASLHVAVTGLVLLMARYYGLRRITAVLEVFLAVTMVATLYLGWHFAVDDVAGVLIAVISVSLGEVMIYPGGHPSSTETDLRAAGPPVLGDQP